MCKLKLQQFFWVILYGSTEDSAVYQAIYSTRISHVSPNVNIGLTPKESKVALSSPEASGHYTHQSVSSVHHGQPIMTPTHLVATTPPPSAPPASMPQPQKSTAVALHPCKIICKSRNSSMITFLLYRYC